MCFALTQEVSSSAHCLISSQTLSHACHISPHPASAQHVSPHPAPAQLVPVHIVPVPVVWPKPRPTKKLTSSLPLVDKAPCPASIQPAADPADPPELPEDDPEVVPLPPHNLTQPPPGQNGYPPCWRKFINHAEYYILHDMVFSHPFPNSGELWVAKAVLTAFRSWALISQNCLCYRSCKLGLVYPPSAMTLLIPISVRKHCQNFITLVCGEPFPVRPM